MYRGVKVPRLNGSSLREYTTTEGIYRRRGLSGFVSPEKRYDQRLGVAGTNP
jgi:hypothetical protein